MIPLAATAHSRFLTHSAGPFQLAQCFAPSYLLISLFLIVTCNLRSVS